MDYNQINKAHLAENMALTYGQDNLTKAREGLPIGTIKTMGGREVIKTADGWRAHTQGSKQRTDEHLAKNPSANHKDEHLQKFSKETPETHLKRVIKDSTDPRLRQHAQNEMDRRKEEEKGLKGTNPYVKGQEVQYREKDQFNKEWDEKTKVTAIHPSGKVLLENGKSLHHLELQKQTKQFEEQSKKGKQDLKGAHEKRGFDESKGDVDVTGKSEKIPKNKGVLSLTKEGIAAAQKHADEMKKLLS